MRFKCLHISFSHLSYIYIFFFTASSTKHNFIPCVTTHWDGRIKCLISVHIVMWKSVRYIMFLDLLHLAEPSLHFRGLDLRGKSVYLLFTERQPVIVLQLLDWMSSFVNTTHICDLHRIAKYIISCCSIKVVCLLLGKIWWAAAVVVCILRTCKGLVIRSRRLSLLNLSSCYRSNSSQAESWIMNLKIVRNIQLKIKLNKTSWPWLNSLPKILMAKQWPCFT